MNCVFREHVARSVPLSLAPERAQTVQLANSFTPAEQVVVAALRLTDGALVGLAFGNARLPCS